MASGGTKNSINPTNSLRRESSCKQLRPVSFKIRTSQVPPAKWLQSFQTTIRFLRGSPILSRPVSSSRQWWWALSLKIWAGSTSLLLRSTNKNLHTTWVWDLGRGTQETRETTSALLTKERRIGGRKSRRGSHLAVESSFLLRTTTSFKTKR